MPILYVAYIFKSKIYKIRAILKNIKFLNNKDNLCRK